MKLYQLVKWTDGKNYLVLYSGKAKDFQQTQIIYKDVRFNISERRFN